MHKFGKKWAAVRRRRELLDGSGSAGERERRRSHSTSRRRARRRDVSSSSPSSSSSPDSSSDDDGVDRYAQKITCWCKKCKGLRLDTRKNVEEHLRRWRRYVPKRRGESSQSGGIDEQVRFWSYFNYVIWTNYKQIEL